MSRARPSLPAWLLATLLLLAALPAFAQERILAYDSVVEVHADGTLDVTERIRVRAEGRSIRRGIFRDFPTRYRDRHGNAVVVDFEVVGVERDGRPEPWFTERMDNGVRVNTGDDSLLPVPLETTYTLRYRTNRQLGFFDAHDELYWNAIGHGWAFPVETGSVEVRLPAAVDPGALEVDGWTGRLRVRSRDFAADVVGPGVARWTLTAPLEPREGLTILLTFPKGTVAAPGRAQAAGWWLRDNLPFVPAIGGLLVLLAFCLKRWHSVGRDPAPGVIVVRYEPPRGESPSALRYLVRNTYDPICMSAELLACAVAGHVRIEHEEHARGGRWTLHRQPDATGTLGDDGRRLLDALLPPGRPELRLGKAKATRVQVAMDAHRTGLSERFGSTMFRLNGGSIAIAIAIVMVTCMLTAVSAIASEGGGMPGALVPLGLCVVVAVAFVFLVPARTPEGRRRLDEIEGFKRYLSVAEQDDLARLDGPGDGTPPPLDAARFEALLPYAVALGVEEAWTARFTAAVGSAAAAAATAGMAWYHGSAGTSPAGFTSAIGQALGTQIASSSTPPGSSSGSFSGGGGGGFSGGGGGGGGGGGR